MEPFAYTIRYRPGEASQNADALSRCTEYVHESVMPNMETTQMEDWVPDYDDSDDHVPDMASLGINVSTGTDQAKLTFSDATVEQWKARGHDTNSIIADPLFVDAARNDYRLQPGSPAVKLGFKPIDLSTAGVRLRRIEIR